MEKERVFRERCVQNNSSLGSDEAVRHRKSTGSGAAILHNPKVDIMTENTPLSPEI